MSRGKHLSLSEARKAGKLDQFAKENPATGDMEQFDGLLDAMAHGEQPASALKKKKAKDRTSDADASED